MSSVAEGNGRGRVGLLDPEVFDGGSHLLIDASSGSPNGNGEEQSSNGQAPGTYEFGRPSETLCRSDINVFYDAQARRTYSSDGIEELTASISDDDLYEPLIVDELDYDAAVRHLGRLEERFGKIYDISSLVSNENGKYYVLTAGHRRLMAIDRILDEDIRFSMYDPSQVFIRCIVYKDAELSEALKRQMAENSHEPVPPVEDAYSIRMYYDEAGVSIAQCARDIARSETKVRNAIGFTNLPPKVRESVEKGHSTYTMAVAVIPLANAYRSVPGDNGQPKYSEEDIESKLLRYIGEGLNNGWGEKRFRNYVIGIINDLKAEQLTLELVSQEQGAETALRQDAARRLARTAINNLDFATRFLDPDAAKGSGVYEVLRQIALKTRRYTEEDEDSGATQDALVLDTD